MKSRNDALGPSVSITNERPHRERWYWNLIYDANNVLMGSPPEIHPGRTLNWPGDERKRISLGAHVRITKEGSLTTTVSIKALRSDRCDNYDEGGFHLGTLEIWWSGGATEMSPDGGRDHPRSYAEMRAWFDQDWLRWSNGFVCPRCESRVGLRLSDARWLCDTCKRKTSATADTIFNKTRTPLTVWFAAAWLLVNRKTGISATHLRREMKVGCRVTLRGRCCIDTVRFRAGKEHPDGDFERRQATRAGRFAPSSSRHSARSSSSTFGFPGRAA